MEKNFDYKDYPDKLNLGCGFDILDGYLNIDINEFHNPDLIGDVTDLDLLPSGFYREIIAQDILEHIERTRTIETLCEWNRLLVQNGILKLRVPDLIGLLSLLGRAGYQDVDKQEELIRCCFGTQAYTGDYHYTSFTRLLIDHYLTVTGFSVLSCSTRDEWLFEIIAEKTGSVKIVPMMSVEIADFLKNTYSEFLHRPPDSGGYNFFFSQLKEGKMKRNDVITAIKNSAEAKEKEKSGLFKK